MRSRTRAFVVDRSLEHGAVAERQRRCRVDQRHDAVDAPDPVASGARRSAANDAALSCTKSFSRLSPAAGRRAVSGLEFGAFRSWPVILLSPPTSVERRADWCVDSEGDVSMKELVYHRLLLPAVERNADRSAFFDGEYRATFGRASRPGRAARVGLRAASAWAGRPVRGDGAQRPPVPRVLPRRVPRRGRHQPVEPAARAEGARVHPRRLGHQGLLHRPVLRAGRRQGPRRGRHRTRRDDRRR